MINETIIYKKKEEEIVISVIVFPFSSILKSKLLETSFSFFFKSLR